ncbi:quinol:cytochrome c oxidoreductase quinone-binding subunit 1 [Dyella jiangningensis]|uniref:NrfD/PsrC family molybdoenzyme membrane anchor subunit n=1 Tax=Dyella sp. AtDHG13 TaxID=1938897 RepID=UPI0008862B5E|nr:NrfD/PsrC family molybdoenzyme membrane anchor subunit [Dyella sp. AtDHG13]PXV55851.1 quinol:cytochrome c oxidoreductase quinone-binding subunit 1 [Dyella sp. AtDHG13]SDK53929.1 quinol:cytochrome c oxidoreductase quinone-binding subunit 1 [Dyella jiangningensis]
MSASPWLAPDTTAERISREVSDIVLARPTSRTWLASFALALLLTGVFMAGIGHLVTTGIGIWGNNIPVAWAFDITNYVWWIAIGMAGTFISAALLLARQVWRASLNRYAETMTVFAVSISGLFPILHLGRPWFFYWLAPYPDRMGVWPQWRSSLLWDFFAIIAYLLVSILYWYVGLLPDLATLRDRANSRGRQVFYGLLALGWRGDAHHWQRYETLSLTLAGLAVPLVFSVHSMVALDFSEGLLPGWHSTLFPPFFVAGALFSGFAMALAIAVPVRRWYGLHRYITPRHLDYLARMVLAAGLVIDYSYAAEIFDAFYSQDRYAIASLMAKFAGPYAWVYWTTIACNVAAIQLLWSRRVRYSPAALMVIALLVLVGMWCERFLLIVNSLFRDFLPSSAGMFYPTVWDLVFLFGSMAFFLVLLLLFARLLPMLSMAELRKLLPRHAGEDA